MATLGSEVVLFGGQSAIAFFVGGQADGGGFLGDTWTFDGSVWTQVSVSSPPPPRFEATMATLP
jgi:hypothetical protein